jgi:hypothetical protein
MHITRKHKVITAFLSALLCFSVLSLGFVFTNNPSVLQHETKIDNLVAHGFALKVDEIFEEEDNKEITKSPSLYPLLFTLSVFLFHTFISIQEKVHFSHFFSNQPKNFIPIYISVENFRL